MLSSRLRRWCARCVACLPVWIGACGSSAVHNQREAEIASVMARADQALILNRPLLVAGKYARMSTTLYDYYRGGVPVFAHDWRAVSQGIAKSDFALAAPLVLSTSDAHPENFGLLLGADGKLSLEPNDFDGADLVPYLWDLRRLAVGMLIGAQQSNPTDPVARAAVRDREGDVVRAVARGYLDTIRAQAKQRQRTRITDGLDNPVLVDLFRRGNKDLAARDELAQLTELDGNGQRHLLRGPPDASDPQEVLAELPSWAYAALPAVLAEYRMSLIQPPSAKALQLLDAARLFGKGVASWPRMKILLLLRGDTDAPDDDLILELKELGDSGVGAWRPPGVYFDSVQERVLNTSRKLWSTPDAEPLWGTASYFGFPVQLRRESEAHKTLRTDRFEDTEGTPEAIIGLAQILGSLLAELHSTPSPVSKAPAKAIAERIGTRDAEFIEEQLRIATSYADQVTRDLTDFRRALSDLGPDLGVPRAGASGSSADLAALLGTPPSPPEPTAP
ncbi:MAG: DUF2252 family protein [Polyangiaceae bacterium]